MTKIRVLLVAAACALAGPALVSAQGIGSVEHDLNYGREYLAAGNPSSAATYFRQAVMLHPDHAEANLLLAVALQRADQADEARPYYERAIELDPALASRSEVKQLARNFGSGASGAERRGPAAAAAASSPSTPVAAVVQEDAPVGSAAYLIDYARGHLKDGNFSAAADYARQALALEPKNAQARALLVDAQQRRAPANASAAARAPGGDPQKVGTPAYFMRYAKYHFGNGNYSGAVDYAKQALAVDPDFAEAKQLLAQARGRADKAAPAKNSCEAQYSSCWSGAMTYTPGSGYSADNARRQQCMVERNICSGRK